MESLHLRRKETKKLKKDQLHRGRPVSWLESERVLVARRKRKLEFTLQKHQSPQDALRARKQQRRPSVLYLKIITIFRKKRGSRRSRRKSQQ